VATPLRAQEKRSDRQPAHRAPALREPPPGERDRPFNSADVAIDRTAFQCCKQKVLFCGDFEASGAHIRQDDVVPALQPVLEVTPELRLFLDREKAATAVLV
jgi:hypothetical protein